MLFRSPNNRLKQVRDQRRRPGGSARRGHCDVAGSLRKLDLPGALAVLESPSQRYSAAPEATVSGVVVRRPEDAIHVQMLTLGAKPLSGMNARDECPRQPELGC